MITGRGTCPSLPRVGRGSPELAPLVLGGCGFRGRAVGGATAPGAAASRGSAPNRFEAGQVGRYDPVAGTWVTWRLPGRAPRAYAVSVDERNDVWLTDLGTNALVRFGPNTETFVALSWPDAGANARDLHGRPGEVWGADSGSDKLVVVRTACAGRADRRQTAGGDGQENGRAGRCRWVAARDGATTVGAHGVRPWPARPQRGHRASGARSRPAADGWGEQRPEITGVVWTFGRLPTTYRLLR